MMIQEGFCVEWVTHVEAAAALGRRRAEEQRRALAREAAEGDPAAALRTLEEEIQVLESRISERESQLAALRKEEAEGRLKRIDGLRERVNALMAAALPERLRAMAQMLRLEVDPLSASPAVLHRSVERADPARTLIQPLCRRLQDLASNMQDNAGKLAQAQAAEADSRASRERFERVVARLRGHHEVSDEVIESLRTASASQLAAFRAEVLVPLESLAAALRESGLEEQPGRQFMRRAPPGPT